MNKYLVSILLIAASASSIFFEKSSAVLFFHVALFLTSFLTSFSFIFREAENLFEKIVIVLQIIIASIFETNLLLSYSLNIRSYLFCLFLQILCLILLPVSRYTETEKELTQEEIELIEQEKFKEALERHQNKSN